MRGSRQSFIRQFINTELYGRKWKFSNSFQMAQISADIRSTHYPRTSFVQTPLSTASLTLSPKPVASNKLFYNTRNFSTPEILNIALATADTIYHNLHSRIRLRRQILSRVSSQHLFQTFRNIVSIFIACFYNTRRSRLNPRSRHRPARTSIPLHTREMIFMQIYIYFFTFLIHICIYACVCCRTVILYIYSTALDNELCIPTFTLN